MPEYRLGQVAAPSTAPDQAAGAGDRGCGIIALASAFSVILVNPANPSSASAATLLTKIASAAERQPAPVVRDSQYEYLKVMDKDLQPGRSSRMASQLACR